MVDGISNEGSSSRTEPDLVGKRQFAAHCAAGAGACQSHLRFPLSSGWSKQTVLNELVHSHNFWSFASTSENQIISRITTTPSITSFRIHQLPWCEIPEVDATGFPGKTRNWCDCVPEPIAKKIPN